MSLKYKVVLWWVICLSSKVVMTGGEVVWVKRDGADSFRVGQDGCTNNASVCESVSATCQDDGSCLCNSTRLSFRHPVITPNITYGDTYGCVNNSLIRLGVGNKSTYCAFSPFQVIPYGNDSATEFKNENNHSVTNCSLYNAWAKFPDNATAVKLQRLNESYVDLNVSNNSLYFKWKRSVPELQGSIITFNLNCSNSSGSKKPRICLRAKVIGTWRADNRTTSDNSTRCGLSPSTTMKPSPSTINVMTTSSMSSVATGPPVEASSNDSDDDIFTTRNIIIIAAAAVVVLMIIVVVVVCCCFKYKKNKRERNIARVEDDDSPKPFRHTDSCLGGAKAYVELPATETTKTFGGHTNPAYQTADNQTVVEANPRHVTTDAPKSGTNEVNFYSDPEFEPDNTKKKKINGATSTLESDPDYASVDVERKEVKDNNSYAEPGYATPDVQNPKVDKKRSKKEGKGTSSQFEPVYTGVDIKRKDAKDNDSYTEPGYATPDVQDPKVDKKRKGVKGTTPQKKEEDESNSNPVDHCYARVDKNRKTVNGKDVSDTDSYPEPGYAKPDVEKKEDDESNSNPVDHCYARVNKNRKNVNEKDVNDTDSYPEPGYATPDVEKKEGDEKNSNSVDHCYAKVDKKRKTVHGTAPQSDPLYANVDEATSQPASSKPGGDAKNAVDNAGFSSPDIKRIEINGDVYALPNKQK